MALTPSSMLPLGTIAPAFTLLDTVSGNSVSSPVAGSAKGTIVAFICNHCPSVKHIIDEFSEFAEGIRLLGINVIAISSNDPIRYPEDAPDEMKIFAERHKFTFPYLFDETQDIARQYLAECTPDLYLFNEENKLVYRGRFDDSTPGNRKPVTGSDLKEATNALLNGNPISEQQFPSIGCNIKWKNSMELH